MYHYRSIGMNFISDKITTRISTVQLREDDILLINIRKDESFNVRDMWELIEAARQIGNGRRFLNLIVVGAHTVPDEASRILSTSEEGSIYKIADAFVISSLIQLMVSNVYMKFHKPSVPTKFFKNVQDAENWLYQF